MLSRICLQIMMRLYIYGALNCLKWMHCTLEFHMCFEILPYITERVLLIRKYIVNNFQSSFLVVLSNETLCFYINAFCISC